MNFLSIVLTVVMLVASWMLYRKMGREGWESIIPIYNTYVLFEELYGNGWKFLLLLIPFYNIYVGIKLYIDLAKAFNKPTGFGVGLIFLTPIFWCILGFGDAVYKDGSEAITEDDFVSSTVEAVSDGTERIYNEAKQKYEDVGGAEGIKTMVVEKAKDVADDAKEKFEDIKDSLNEKSTMDTLKDLSELKDKGIITEEEFNAKKEEILKRI